MTNFFRKRELSARIASSSVLSTKTFDRCGWLNLVRQIMISTRKEPRLRSCCIVDCAENAWQFRSLMRSEIGSPLHLQSLSLRVHRSPRRRIAQAALIPNTVWVGADGKFDSEPDTALVQFNISAQEDKLQDANQTRNSGSGTGPPASALQWHRSQGCAGRTLRGAAGLRLQESEAQAGGLPRRHRHQRQGEGLLQGGSDHRRSRRTWM